MKDREVVYIGIDVSKETLDIDAGEYGVRKIENTSAKIRPALAAIARKADTPPQVCFESGAYLARLMAECQGQGIAYSVLNPCKVSYFARSIAPAKTDALDARAIRLYAEITRPAPRPPPRPMLTPLRELVRVRGTLKKHIGALHPTLETVTDPDATQFIRSSMAFLEKKVEKCDRLIAEVVKADEEMSGLVDALSGVKGVGTLTAIQMVARMPELGTLGRRKAAALAGLAPRTRESGQWQGKSFIGGGRKEVRTALFMSATVATRHNPEMKALYERLKATGKPHKVALTAVMRRLLCHLDSVARNYHAQRKTTA